MISNSCEGEPNKQQSSKKHSCPLLAPKGLRVGIKGQMLAVAPGDDITFTVHQEQVGQKLFSFCFFLIYSVSVCWTLSFFNRVTPAAPSIRWILVMGYGQFTRTWLWLMNPSSTVMKIQAFTRSKWRLRIWLDTMRLPCTSRSQVGFPDELPCLLIRQPLKFIFFLGGGVFADVSSLKLTLPVTNIHTHLSWISINT